MNITFHGLSNKGSRSHNEDSFMLPPNTPQLIQQKGYLFLIADGVGGHHAGEVASKMAVDIIPKHYYQHGSDNVKSSLLAAIEQANQHIFQEAKQRNTERTMATTVTAAVLKDGKLTVANVGDSRTYLIHNGEIEQLSVDHTWVNEQLKAGIITPEQAKNHPQGNVVTRSVGHRATVDIDVFPARPVGPGHSLILCSDGLVAVVDDPEIAEIVHTTPQVEHVTEKLVQLTLQRGAPDNVTVLAAHFGERGVIAHPPTQSGMSLSEAQKQIAAIPSPPPSKQKSSPLPLIIGGVLLLIVLVVGAFTAGLWLTSNQAEPEQASVETFASDSALTVESTATALPPTSTPMPALTLEPTSTSSADEADAAETAIVVEIPPPTLLEPVNGTTIQQVSDPITLKWSGQPLLDDEIYVVSVRNKTTGKRYPVWSTEEPTLTIPEPLNPGIHTWLVMVEKNNEWVSRSKEVSFTIQGYNNSTAQETEVEISATAPPDIAPGSLGNIVLLGPAPSASFSKGTSTIQFRWQLNHQCNLPSTLGFELRIWQDGQPPAGALDAVNQQGDIFCDSDGSLTFTVGDLQSAPGVNGAESGEFMWDVIVVQIDPSYDSNPVASSGSATFSLSGESGGGGPNTGGGEKPPVVGE